MRALAAAGAGEAMGEDAAVDVAAELALHVRRHRPVVVVTVAAVRRCGSGWAARCACRHWPQGLGRAAEVSRLNTRRRRGIDRRGSHRQWPLTGKFHGDTDWRLVAALGRSSIDMDTVEVPFHTKRYLASIAHDGREGDAGSTTLVLNPSVKTPCAEDKGLRTEYGATSLALMK